MRISNTPQLVEIDYRPKGHERSIGNCPCGNPLPDYVCVSDTEATTARCEPCAEKWLAEKRAAMGMAA